MMLNHLILGQSLTKARLDRKPQRSRAEARKEAALITWLKAEAALIAGLLHRSHVAR